MRATTYRGLMVTAPKKPRAASFFETLARRAGGEIPPAYVDFWRGASGWELPYACIVPEGERGRPYVFEPFDLSELQDAQDDLEACWFRGRLPAAALAIGATGGEDDTLLLDLTPEHHGRVLAWVSARPTAGRRKDALHVVAESFDAYLDALVLAVADLEDGPRSPKLDAWLATLPAPRTLPGLTGLGAVYAAGLARRNLP